MSCGTQPTRQTNSTKMILEKKKKKKNEMTISTTNKITCSTTIAETPFHTVGDVV
jgi:hypothetical protein